MEAYAAAAVVVSVVVIDWVPFVMASLEVSHIVVADAVVERMHAVVGSVAAVKEVVGTVAAVAVV